MLSLGLATPCERLGRCVLERAALAAGGKVHSLGKGDVAFRWKHRPKAFVLLRSGKVSVRFRTLRRKVLMAECRASGGQDCMPVTAALLAGTELSVEAVCLARTTWLELAPEAFRSLVERDPDFRRALFAQHARRLPYFFLRVAGPAAGSLDQRLADWLVAHAEAGVVRATHQAMATDLLTAREVVSRRLRRFAERGWIVQGRGEIVLAGAATLSRLSWEDPA
jgi:CRP/FNR family transcriptional regulator